MNEEKAAFFENLTSFINPFEKIKMMGGIHGRHFKEDFNRKDSFGALDEGNFELLSNYEPQDPKIK
jgi:hypothetical protein